MTEKELRAWMRKESLTDAWFVSAEDGHVDSNLQTLTWIHERYAATTGSSRKTVWILHETQKNRKDPAWIELDLASFSPENAEQPAKTVTAATTDRSADQPQQRRPSRRNKRRARGVVIQLIVLLVVLIIGAGVWYSLTREEEERITFVSEEEAHSRMLATLQQNLLRNNPNSPESEGEPIRTVVSATQRMLMIKNSNLENWPNFSLRIITEAGKVYTCTYDETIPAYSTLSIVMRKIQTASGEALNRDDLKSGTTIELTIPGYKTWSSKL